MAFFVAFKKINISMNIINNSKLIYKKISLSSGIFFKEEKKGSELWRVREEE